MASMTIAYYGIATLILILCMPAYMALARRFGIIDQPGERSSHTRPTIRGGGIIFPIAIFLWYALFGWQQPYMVGGLLVISAVSFADDLHSLPGKVRILVHLVAVGLLFQQMGIYQMHWYLLLGALVLTIGWLNAFNFMDGINGISAFYSLVLLLSFSIVNNAGAMPLLGAVAGKQSSWIPFLPGSIVGVTFLATLVFAFFNARPRAMVFAGDVGSISLAFIMSWMMIRMMIASREPTWILFFSVYGIDTVSTIIIRLYRKENIFQAHRLHLYQLLANQRGWPHLKVAAMYASLQMLVNVATIVLFFYGMLTWPVMIALMTLLWVTYIIVRVTIMNHH